MVIKDQIKVILYIYFIASLIIFIHLFPVKSQGTSGRVYVPPDWIGRRVAIVRLD